MEAVAAQEEHDHPHHGSRAATQHNNVRRRGQHHGKAACQEGDHLRARHRIERHPEEAKHRRADDHGDRQNKHCTQPEVRTHTPSQLLLTPLPWPEFPRLTPFSVPCYKICLASAGDSQKQAPDLPVPAILAGRSAAKRLSSFVVEARFRGASPGHAACATLGVPAAGPCRWLEETVWSRGSLRGAPAPPSCARLRSSRWHAHCWPVPCPRGRKRRPRRAPTSAANRSCSCPPSPPSISWA